MGGLAHAHSHTCSSHVDRCSHRLPQGQARRRDTHVAEALQAVEESTLASQAEGLTSASVEITTSFTIGQAVETAAQEIKTFIESQLPCAAITLTGATLTVEYGAKPGNCTYKGQTFSGTHSITVAKNDQAAQVEVHHTWTDLTNGSVTLNGNADVTWDFSAKSRHVVHTAEWTRVSDGFKVTGEGDRTQTVLAGGLGEGIKVDGSRSWKSSRGQWDLGIDGVEMRWIDPVPAGRRPTAPHADEEAARAFRSIASTRTRSR